MFSAKRTSSSIVSKNRLSRAFKNYAKQSKSAYLGEVSPHAVDQHLVRGFTTSNTHKDTNHSVGHAFHHDYIVLSREDNNRQYIITEVDLHTLRPFSHFFITPNDLPENLFAELLKKHPHHRHTPFSAGDSYLPAFKHRYSILTRPEHFTRSLYYVTPDSAKCIAEIKQSYLFEVNDTSLFVYDYSHQQVTEKTLHMQVQFACTLATLLENRNT